MEKSREEQCTRMHSWACVDLVCGSVWGNVPCTQLRERAVSISIAMHGWAARCLLRGCNKCCANTFIEAPETMPLQLSKTGQWLLSTPEAKWSTAPSYTAELASFPKWSGNDQTVIILLKLLLHFHVGWFVIYNWFKLFHSYIWIVSVSDLGFGTSVILSHVYQFFLAISDS